MRRARCTAIAVAVVLVARTAPLLAGEPSSSPQQPSGSDADPLVPGSTASLGIGLGATVLGGVVVAAAPSEVRCGQVAGCLPSSNEGTARDVGVLAIGGGLGLAAVGGLGMVATRGWPLAPGELRDGPGAATTGFVLTSLSGAALGSGVALAVAGNDVPRPERATPLFIGSGVLAIAGVPLLLAGGSREDPVERGEEAFERHAEAEREAARERARREEKPYTGPTAMRSPRTAAAGYVVMGLGTAGGVALAAVAASPPASRGFMDFDGLGHSIGFAGASALSFAVGLGVGIPLVVSGSTKVPTAEVSIGLGTVTANGTF